MPASLTGTGNAKINAGELNTRVTLMHPVYNEYGDEIASYAPVQRVWAAVLPTFGQEQNEADRITAATQVTVVIRYRSDIDARWRVIDHEHTYEVLALVDATRERTKLILTCKEVL